MHKLLRLSPVALAFGYVSFGIVALVLFAYPLWHAWQVTVEVGRAEILSEDAQRLSTVFDRGGPSGLIAFINERVGLQIAGERILLLTDARLRPLAGNLNSWPGGVPDERGTYTRTVNLNDRPTRVMFVRSTLPGGYNLLVGRDVAKYDSLTRYFWTGLAAAIAILTLVGIIGGILIQQALLSRIHGLRHMVSAIMQGDWKHRLPTRPKGDELDNFSETINGMFDQIEQLVNGVRNVSNSIAHDLRTPLTELRSRLEELALNRPGREETFAEIDAAVQDVDRVIGIFNALLRLAEIDTGLRRSGFVQVDFAKVAAEVTEFYAPAAEIKNTHLIFVRCEPMKIQGDPLLLAQAVGNLIDNALKYAPEHSEIVVSMTADAESVEVMVCDNGPGIPDAEKSKVAERFYRGDTSRGTPGVGLGLSMVDAVAKLHGGVLAFEDNNPGLRARMRIASGATQALTGDVVAKTTLRVAPAHG
jgi:signal transduction histidine kinase